MNENEQEAYEEALRVIEACRRTEETVLDLSGLGLTAVPQQRRKLTKMA